MSTDAERAGGMAYRDRVLAEIRPMSLLDALARIAYFNRRELREGSQPIDPKAIGLTIYNQAMEAAWSKVERLYHEAMLAADVDLSGAPGRESRAADLRAKHPGFSEESYDLAMTDGYIAMR
ncbi:hypothetical protein [Labrys neptuniae]